MNENKIQANDEPAMYLLETHSGHSGRKGLKEFLECSSGPLVNVPVKNSGRPEGLLDDSPSLHDLWSLGGFRSSYASIEGEPELFKTKFTQDYDIFVHVLGVYPISEPQRSYFNYKDQDAASYVRIPIHWLESLVVIGSSADKKVVVLLNPKVRTLDNEAEVWVYDLVSPFAYRFLSVSEAVHHIHQRAIKMPKSELRYGFLNGHGECGRYIYNGKLLAEPKVLKTID